MIRRKGYTMIALASLLALVSACSNSKGTSSPEASPSSSSPAASATTTSAEQEGGPLVKHDPPITVSTVMATDASVKFKEGESYENNDWIKSYRDKLGIEIKYDWIVNSDQYDQKLNVSITSGALPDFFKVNATQLQQLIAAGALEDLTPYIDKYASEPIKTAAFKGTNALKAASSGGKIMAFPPGENYVNGLDMIWVRTDWLKKLNLPEPKTMDDVLRISEAFTTQDPDGNGKNDTFGLALSNELWAGYSGLRGFVNGYHAYEGIWVQDGSGKLEYGSIQPEMKTALAKLQEMFKQGQIDPEFGVKNSDKSAELAVSGKVGLNFGQVWNPLYPLNGNVLQDPNADWHSYPIVSIDAQPAIPQSSASFNSFYVVKKGAKHPEALIQLINMNYENLVGPNADATKYHSDNGIELFKYRVVTAGGGNVTDVERHIAVVDALKSRDPSKLDGENKGYYDKIVDYLDNGNRDGWGQTRVFGEGGSEGILQEYFEGRQQLMKDEFFGAPTATMKTKKAALDKLELETFTRIILGSPLSDFDKFVEDWKKLGGDSITQEVNEWYAANH